MDKSHACQCPALHSAFLPLTFTGVRISFVSISVMLSHSAVAGMAVGCIDDFTMRCGHKTIYFDYLGTFL